MGLVIRLLPVAFIAVAAAAWFNDIQGGGPWVARNLVPLSVVVLLAMLTLYRGGGRWTGSGYRLPLGTLGFAVPALGLSTYMHYAYSVNLDNMFDSGAGDFFRFLPLYTSGAGAIGFAIGWIVGRNV